MRRTIIDFVCKNWLKFILGGLAACGITISLASCGVTKATISKPAEGTSTTITITTNNPISTNVEPTINTNLGK